MVPGSGTLESTVASPLPSALSLARIGSRIESTDASGAKCAASRIFCTWTEDEKNPTNSTRGMEIEIAAAPPLLAGNRPPDLYAGPAAFVLKVTVEALALAPNVKRAMPNTAKVLTKPALFVFIFFFLLV